MRILITGGSGFIGTHLSNYYAEKDAILYKWNQTGIENPDGTIVGANLTQADDVKKELERIRPTTIFHCAGSADVARSVSDHYGDLVSNYITTENIIFGLKNGVVENCRCILLSSAAVYGNPIELPIGEDQELKPLSPYALHKRAAEDVCLYANRNWGFSIKIARIFSVYGPGLRKQIFWDMFQKYSNYGKLELFGSGYESRDYIYIDDLISALALIAEDSSDEAIFNVANGEETTIREAAESFSDAIGMPHEKITFMGERREGDPINWRADISKLQALGYEKKTEFRDGIGKYVEWVKCL